MADNTDINVGTGATIAADDIGAGVLAQRVKPVWGPDGTGTDVDTPTGLPVTPVPGSAGGWTPAVSTGLTNTKVVVKASAGVLGGYAIFNPNTAVMYVQVWDALTASVTVGTTSPTYVLPVPAMSTANVEWTVGVHHGTGIIVAATAGPANNTAPTNALVATILYA